MDRQVGVISIALEDPLTSQDEGTANGSAARKDSVTVELPGAMSWT